MYVHVKIITAMNIESTMDLVLELEVAHAALSIPK